MHQVSFQLGGVSCDAGDLPAGVKTRSGLYAYAFSYVPRAPKLRHCSCGAIVHCWLATCHQMSPCASLRQASNCPHLMLSPPKLTTGNLWACLARSLSDPPAPGETIYMNLTVNGNIPGNRWDATPHLTFSKTRDTFTDGQHIRRNITVSMISAPWSCI